MKPVSPTEQQEYAEKKRRLEAALELGFKGPFREVTPDQLIKEIREEHPEFLKFIK